MLWSTKYRTPCSVVLISQPNGRGIWSAMDNLGSSHCVVLLLWLTKYVRPSGSSRFSVGGNTVLKHFHNHIAINIACL